ncbi:hypothetical protein Tco_0221987 [Tanacetum coccineum]
MEDEFYNLVVKGNDLKTYIRRFQELAVLCPNHGLQCRGISWKSSSMDYPEKPMIVNESLRMRETSSTTTITTVTMITIDNRIENKKPSKLILPPIDMLETFPYVKDVDYITRDLAVSSVMSAGFVNKIGLRPSTAKYNRATKKAT